MMKANRIKNILFILIFVAFIVCAALLYRMLTVKTGGDTADQDTSTEATCNTGNFSDSISTSSEPEPAADFTVYDADGNPVRLADQIGKPIVINFWASWCGPCQSEIYDFQDVYETYGDDVIFMMINLTDGTTETVESASSYVEEHNLTFPVYYDTDGSAANAYSIVSIPQTYFIDADGNITGQILGATNSGTLTDGISSIFHEE